MKVDFLDWDSEFLGIPVVRMSAATVDPRGLREGIASLRMKGVGLVYLFLDAPLSERDAAQLRAYPVDEKLTYRIPIDGSCHGEIAPAVTPYIPEMPLGDLEDLALQSGLWSRFRVDPDFPREKFVELYRLWLRRSITKEIADEVLTISETRRVCALITLSEAGHTGRIGLLAVDAGFRGRGFGTQLVNAAKHWFWSRRLTYGEVVTQKANLAACKLYESCGFRVHRVEYLYHLWLCKPHGH